MKISVVPDASLYDEKVAIIVEGLNAGDEVTLQLSWSAGSSKWTSAASFLADERGTVDVTSMPAKSGSYVGVAPMGLFWSAEKTTIAAPVSTRRKRGTPEPPYRMQLDALLDGRAVASTTFLRKLQLDGLQGREVTEDGLYGVFFVPPHEEPIPGLLVLGGSAGVPPEITTRALADQGYACLGLSYFKMKGLPKELNEIPLEYFRKGLSWLAEQPGVDPNRLGIVGKSRGGEVALVLGVIYPEIDAVVAYAPSHVVWAGTGHRTSSWTFRGRPIPFIEFPGNLTALKKYAPKDLFNYTLCWAALENRLSVRRATIPVERINGGVLLITGKEDSVWPSSYMADQIIERLRRNNFPHPYQHLSYDKVGHSILWPYLPTMNPKYDRETAAAKAKAWEDAWRNVLRFLASNLQRAKAEVSSLGGG